MAVSLRFYGTDGTTTPSLNNGEYTVTDNVYPVDSTTNTFTFGDPNFNVLSFRSNAVLRWEWRPGSTLFLVWQQNKSDSGDPNSRVNLGEFFRSVGGPGTNFFAIKVTYWIPVT